MLRGAFRDVANFLRLLRGMPPQRSGVSRAGAKAARQASHVHGAGGRGFSGTSATDKFLGKAIAGGHEQTVYGDPGSERPVVGHGGRPPIHRRQSGWVTALLIVLLVLVVISLL